MNDEMSGKERLRETLDGPLTAEYIESRASSGWRPAEVVWERSASSGDGAVRVEIPYGLQIDDSGEHLIESDAELRVVHQILAEVVRDRSMTDIAEILDSAGWRQRDGRNWSAVAVFNLLPRVIELAPQIYASERWQRRRQQYGGQGRPGLREVG